MLSIPGEGSLPPELHAVLPCPFLQEASTALSCLRGHDYPEEARMCEGGTINISKKEGHFTKVLLSVFRI